MFTDAGNVTDIVFAGFDCVVNVTLKVKISVKGHPKIPCVRGWVNTVTEDINRYSQEFFFFRGHLLLISMNSVLTGLSLNLFVNIQSSTESRHCMLFI